MSQVIAAGSTSVKECSSASLKRVNKGAGMVLLVHKNP
jgi:hypothetical protein